MQLHTAEDLTWHEARLGTRERHGVADIAPDEDWGKMEERRKEAKKRKDQKDAEDQKDQTILEHMVHI